MNVADIMDAGSLVMGVLSSADDGGDDITAALAGPTNCTKGPDWGLFIHCSIIPSLCILLILSFFGKLYNLRMRSLFGIKHLAVVYPINLLDDHEHRWSHAIAFGATASIFFDLFSGDFISLYLKTDEAVASSVKIFLGAVATLELGVILFPFFACISSPSALVGNLLGFIYAAVWFSVQLSLLITCPNIEGGPGFPYEEVIIQLPVLIFTFLLMIRFLYYLIMTILKRIQNEKVTSEEKLMQSYQAQHVKALLRPPPPPKVYTRKWEQIVYHWYEPTQNFIYPTRIICTFVVAVLCEYQIAIRLTYSLDVGYGLAFAKLREWYTVYAVSEGIPPAQINATYLALDRYESAVHVSWYLGTALSITISLCYIAHIFVCFRKHILRLYKGDRQFLPDASLNSAKSMTGSLQYCGFQIAYYLSGYVIMNLTSFLFIYIISGAVVIPLMKDAWEYINGFLNVVVPLFVVAFLVFGSQPILAKRVFLQPKLNQNDKDKPLALQHRDFYHIFSYFLVFLNVLVGMLSCVIRILTGLFVGIFLLCRIDRPILMRGYEHLDQSYQAYIGNLNMINAHSHPVVVVFCQVLVNRIISRKRAKLGRSRTGTNSDMTASYSFVEHDIELPNSKPISQGVVNYGSVRNSSNAMSKGITPHARATMRWQLAYTLLFNPSLLGTRKRSRQMTYKEMEKRILKVATLLPHRQQVLKRSQEPVHGGNVGLVGVPAGRVRSDPSGFMKHETDDRLAAMLLNQELREDQSDIEGDISEAEAKDVKFKIGADVAGDQENDSLKNANLQSNEEHNNEVVNSTKEDTKMDSSQSKELKPFSDIESDSQNGSDDDPRKETMNRTEQASKATTGRDGVNDTQDDAVPNRVQEPDKIVIFLDEKPPSSEL